jgi:hypothetical protein
MTRISLLLLFPVILFAVSCERVPEADFYEVEGIISIHAASEGEPDGWEVRNLTLTRSLVSLSTGTEFASPLKYSFYLSNPGLYRMSVMAADGLPDTSRSLAVRISDNDNFILENFRIEPRKSNTPEWVSSSSDGREMEVQFNRPGSYSIQIDHDGKEGMIIHSINLVSNNNNLPQGMGYPETINPNTDPIFEKRQQITGIPPAKAFGVIARPDLLERISGLEPDFDLNTFFVDQYGMNREAAHDSLAAAFDQSKEDETDRGFVLYPSPQLDNPQFKRFPALWFSQGYNGFEELRDQLRWMSDSAHPAYEIPFFAPLPEWISGNAAYGHNDSEELLQRWIQFSSMSPVMVLPLPENDESLNISGETARQIKIYTDLRRNLFPFLYSYSLRARTSGVKTVTSAGSHPGAFLYGEELLAVPVTEPGQDRMAIRFPEGRWYSWWSGELFEGDRTWVTELYPDRLPLYVKAGSIIPQRIGSPAIADGTNDSLLIDIYSGGVSSFRLYEDDGTSLNYLNGDFTTTAFRWFEQEERATFNIGAMVWGRGEGYRRQTHYTLQFRYLQRPLTITANNEPVPMGEAEGQWHYDERQGSVIIRWTQPSSRRTEFVFRFDGSEVH